MEKDEAEAVVWYGNAAGWGYRTAPRNLGVCYKYGTGVEKADAEAVV